MLRYKPDILIVPECEHPDHLLFVPDTPKPTDLVWFGNNKHKGLGVFSYSSYRFAVHKDHNKACRWIIPISVTGGPFEFTLLAIWANNPNDPDGQYVEQIWKAIQYYDALLTNKSTMLMGDFNSNTIWDRKRRISNHSNVVKLLESKGIRSVYHAYFREQQGREKRPTLYMYRHKDKPYHIDYCFASADLTQKLREVKVGTYKSWCKYSDHVPVIVTFSDGRNTGEGDPAKKR